MTPLYLYVLTGSLAIPLLYSFFGLDFIKKWKNFTLSTTIIALFFLIWDLLFTQKGVWGFNHDYCVGIYLFQIPLEEFLFFFIIPFCSVFTHYAFFYAFPRVRLNQKITLVIAVSLIILCIILIVTNFDKAYTFVNFSFLLVILTLGLIHNQKLLQQFFISFLIILIPFFMVNGMLTGAITDNPIVWYDNIENLGIRLGTIPVEDIGYAFSMLFGNLLIFEDINKRH